MKNLRRLSILLLFYLVILRAGEYADAFLEMGVSARALAMGNCSGTLDNTETAFLSNPAGLGNIMRTRLGLMYASQFGLANHNYAGLALPVKPGMTLAVSWIRFGVDDIPIRPDIIRTVADKEQRRDSIVTLANTHLKTFNDAENALFISVGKFNSGIMDLGWRYSKFRVDFPIGVNFKLIHKRLYNLEGYGLGLDVGGRIRVHGEELFDISNLGFLSLGLALKDITGTTIYWNTRRQDQIRITPAAAFALEQPLNRWRSKLNFAVEKDYRYAEKARYGLEIIYAERIACRFGLKNTGLTTGFGLNFKAMKKIVQVDYSFYNHDLGISHRLGSSIVF